MRSLEPVSVADYVFPPDDLLHDLVNLYFDRVNNLMPLLHRPTFNTCVAGALHHEDDGFAALLLLVCACGARFSKDLRVLADGSDNWHSAGWRWFIQVQTKRRAINLRPPRLYDLQIPTASRSWPTSPGGRLTLRSHSLSISICMDRACPTPVGRRLALGYA